ncbi:hypothetical protein PV10_07509 [Exophiala mesophila]|uniref:FAD dependent oxidoreductase domain-containing protein n=1 Tax=Exophiala mesophila TaxID=212818 RepID=A0A0D1ZTQ1_EXOME|nr:uncharacterized protein PV10_07509 [Exophiala mesophila]KIV90178.1 hypothetical protein PV10_07509 [Exophiala mesophila]
MPEESRDPILVIGAGVLGLSTATLLQDTYPNSCITIVAAELPGTSAPSVDYASMWAGAHYRPIPRSTPQLEDEAQLAMRSAQVMKTISTQSPEAGVAFMQGVEYLDSLTQDVIAFKTGDVYAGKDDGFRILDQSELPTAVQWGCEYRTFCVNVRIYCQWLLDRFVRRGGTVIQQRLPNAAAAFEMAREHGLGQVKTVVNCSGRNFDQDAKMTIIRGQTVLVRQQYHQTITRQNRDGTWAFLIPRPRNGGTIVGGTKEIGDHESQPRPQTRKTLLQNAVNSFPDFVDKVDDFDVVQDNVGRRPWREGGVRTEVEFIDGECQIIHGYGAGGRGYELSWGVAERILGLVRQSTGATPRL